MTDYYIKYMNIGAFGVPFGGGFFKAYQNTKWSLFEKD